MDNYGLWAVLGVFITITYVVDFGIWKASVYWLPRRPELRDQYLAAATLLCIAIGGSFVLVLLALVTGGWQLFGAAVAAHDDLTWWMAAAVIIVVLSGMLTGLVRGALESLLHGYVVNLGYALLTLLLYATAAVISLWTSDPRALLVGSACVYFVTLLAHVMYLVRIDAFGWKKPGRAIVLSLLIYGLRSSFADLPNNLLVPSLLYLFVVLSPNPVEFGLFDIALKIVILATTALGLLAQPFFALTANAERREHLKVHDVARKFLRVTVALAAIGLVAYWFWGQKVLEYMFDQEGARIFDVSFVVLCGAAFARLWNRSLAC